MVMVISKNSTYTGPNTKLVVALVCSQHVRLNCYAFRISNSPSYKWTD